MDRITHKSPRQRGYGSTSSLRNDFLKHTRKHEKGREETKQEAQHTASGGLSGQEVRTVRDGPRGLSGLLPRTVRANTADRPAYSVDRLLNTHRTNRDAPAPQTVRGEHADRSPGTRGPSALCCGPSETPSNRKPKTRRIETKGEQEHEEHGRTLAARTVRQDLADRPPGADRAENARPRKSTPPNHHRISQIVAAMETRVWVLEKRHTRML
jgi:hypothetical protein